MRSSLPHRFHGRSPWSLLLLPCTLALAGWAVATHWQPTPLKAQPWGGVDTDCDGLPDAQEVILGTDPLAPDTDHDGYGDGEEFALQTYPRDANSVPRGLSLSIGLTARGEGNRVKIFAAVLDPDGSVADNTIRFGALVGGQIVPVNFDSMRAAHSGHAVGAKGGRLFLMEFDVPRGTFKLRKAITYFAVVGAPGSTAYAAADKVDIFKDNRVVILRHILTDPAASVDPNAGQNPGTTIHQPIPPAGDGGVPIGWEPGQVCFQETAIVGASGAVVTHEVIAADCEDGWDTYCASDCAGTVGSSYQTIDTGVLLGG